MIRTGDVMGDTDRHLFSLISVYLSFRPSTAIKSSTISGWSLRVDRTMTFLWIRGHVIGLSMNWLWPLSVQRARLLIWWDSALLGGNTPSYGYRIPFRCNVLILSPSFLLVLSLPS